MLPPTVDDLQGDAGAKVADFFALWNADLPPHLANINGTICDTVINRHGCARFSSWFKMPSNTIDGIIKEAFKGAQGGEGWREAIEDQAGFRFPAPTAPDATDLYAAQKKTPAAQEKKAITVGQRLAQSGELITQVLSAACFDCVETVDPINNTITELEVRRVTDAIVMDIAARHGDFACGSLLLRVYGKQAKARLPNLPDRGTTPGSRRDWAKMIDYKLDNLKYVRRQPPPPPSTLASTRR